MIAVGDWVEVKSKEEILKTLDSNGRLEGMPFMPQMFQYCGKRFRVYKSAYKSCDTVSGKYIGLAVKDSVHLQHRCDGEHFGGCQANCLIFWKEAWLRPVNSKSIAPATKKRSEKFADFRQAALCTEADVIAATKTVCNGETVYSCQATSLLEFAKPLKWWDARQYAKAYTSGNRTAANILSGLAFLLYCYGTRAHRGKVGAPARWLYDRFSSLIGAAPFPKRKGLIPAGKKTPKANLGLQPGELVQIKSYAEILSTMDENCSNRGLAFDAELVPYCGNVYRVKGRVHRFIDEKTGKMKTLQTPAVMLEGVVCKARYCGQRTFCPREIYLWWREIWLKRVHEEPAKASASGNFCTVPPTIGFAPAASREQRRL